MAIEPREFRNALGCFATGVTVITTVDEAGGPVGITANSFTSLSLDPPLVLFCLDRKAMSFESFHRNRHFAVNMLREDQQALSAQFATSNIDKWSGVEFEAGANGCPILAGCIATLQCDVNSIYEGGDHVIIVGQVVDVDYQAEPCRPLLYYRGRYNGVAGT
jgi:flavin reductase (DIM6/NTAB) family NADH-FMN oxidoreductase RutF